ncbi:hypothetical protein [Paenibacillus elgii]|nr:hypothetical protein [Paenibacillus elgii]
MITDLLLVPIASAAVSAARDEATFVRACRRCTDCFRMRMG